MSKIFSISVPKDDEYLLDELDHMPGTRSKHVVDAIKLYLKEHKVDSAKPYWFVEGKDYSHLDIEVRKSLVQFGYSDAELDALKVDPT